MYFRTARKECIFSDDTNVDLAPCGNISASDFEACQNQDIVSLRVT